ncbi:MAG: hypothetical protein HYW49_09315 [Deltaproteobacteria bacterium]|nr:hypothetical protein [Deltaproteobacteria bacterium]
MLPVSCHFPFTPARQRALQESDRELRAAFELLTSGTDSGLRDAVHYSLFRIKDRFCMSAAWLVSQELGIASTQIGPALCALEMVRCAIGTPHVTRPTRGSVGLSRNFIDPRLTLEAAVCLIAMASDLVLSRKHNPEMTDSERARLAGLLGSTLSPLQAYSKIHAETRLKGRREGFSAATDCPFFETAGIILDTAAASRAPEACAGERMRGFFRKLGRLSCLTAEFRPEETGNEDLAALTDSSQDLPWHQVMDLVKTLEAEILDDSAKFGIRASTIEIVTPLTSLFETQIQ